MHCEILINLLSEFNDHNIIAIQQLKPKEIVFIRSNEEKFREIFEDINNFISKKVKKVLLVEHIIDIEDMYNSLYKIVKIYNSKDVIINVSGGNQLVSLLLNQIANKMNILSLFIDTKNNNIVVLNNGKKMNFNKYNLLIKIDNFIQLFGGNIIEDSTNLFNEYKYHSFINYIIKNYKLWKNVKALLRDSNTLSSLQDSLNATFHFGTLKTQQRNETIQFLTDIAELKIIYPYTQKNNSVNIKFYDKNLKKFLMVSGSWLEALTLQVIENFENVRDIKSGVKFYWDETAKEVENELDVCVITNTSIICISCKDSRKYDLEALNELFVYAEKIGGNQSIKVLVSTSLPNKQSVIKRAKEMDIHLIIFDGDLEGFKKELKPIIK